MKLFLDDIRNPPDETWTIARTHKEAINFLLKEKISILSLDHDLGEIKTGYDVAKFIEEKVFTDKNFLPPQEIKIHSANPVGRRNIEMCINSIKRLRNET